MIETESKASVLVVEDENIIAKDIVNTLRSLGYVVAGLTDSGEEAIKKTEETRPDLVMMDIVLKGKMDGIEAADYIKTRFRIPVIFLTAYDDETTIRRAKVTAPFGYILKPFLGSELFSGIEITLYRHRLEEETRKSEEKFRYIFNTFPIGIEIYDTKGQLLEANRACLEIFGIKDISGLMGFNLFKDPNLPGFVREKLAGGESVRYEVHFDLNKVKKSKLCETSKSGIIYLEILITPMSSDITGDMFNYLVQVIDITDRKLAEEELKESRNQMRKLSIHREKEREEELKKSRDQIRKLSNNHEKEREEELKKSQDKMRDLSIRHEKEREEERIDIARGIHDELGQLLTALKMDLTWLGKKLSPEQKSLLEKIKSMTKLVDTSIHAVHQISTKLRSGILDDLGLCSVMEWQIGEFQKYSRIECEVVFEPEEITVDQELSAILFRTLQEALTNVARHSGATKVKVGLKEKTGEIELEVKDNGKGITWEQVIDPESLGLLGIRERVGRRGGVLNIDGDANRGTTLSVNIPLHCEDER
ncbi:MAG: response regulator [Chloroflexi bacterium]|nr:response regulator [Chloroflexota bacterium]